MNQIQVKNNKGKLLFVIVNVFIETIFNILLPLSLCLLKERDISINVIENIIRVFFNWSLLKQTLMVYPILLFVCLYMAQYCTNRELKLMDYVLLNVSLYVLESVLFLAFFPQTSKFFSFNYPFCSFSNS